MVSDPEKLKRVDEALAKQLQRSIENNARLVARIKEMEAVLQTAQEIFAVVVNPLDCTDASVRPLWEKCREIECKIRDILQPKDGAK